MMMRLFIEMEAGEDGLSDRLPISSANGGIEAVVMVDDYWFDRCVRKRSAHLLSTAER